MLYSGNIMILNLILLILFQKRYLYKVIGYEFSITMQTKIYNEDTKEVTIMRLALFWFKSPNDKIYNLRHSP
jgi:hypothetical protein